MKIGRGHYTSVAGLLAAGALIAGCGGGADDSTSPRLTQSELSARAAAICRPADKRIEAGARRYLGPGRPTSQQFERFVTAAVVPNTQQVIDGFQGLTPPANRAATYSALVRELQSVNDRLRANPKLLAQRGDPFARSHQLAKQVGLDACVGD